MKIVKFPHPSLFSKCESVTVFGEELKVLLDDMWETMKGANGLGLAANQVDIPLRMFVMEGPNGRINVVNPHISSESKLFIKLREGCLSAPGEFVLIPRHEWIQLMYQDETGTAKQAVLKGLYAVCAQHELEHLEGKGFLENKNIPKNHRKMLAKKWGL